MSKKKVGKRVLVIGCPKDREGTHKRKEKRSWI